MKTETGRNKNATRRRIAATIFCLALLMILLLAPGHGVHLFSASPDPEDTDLSLVDDAGGSVAADDTTVRWHESVDVGGVSDLLASGDRDHRASLDTVDDPGLDDTCDGSGRSDRCDDGGLGASGGQFFPPFTVPGLHASADNVLNGVGNSSPFGAAGSFGSGGYTGGGFLGTGGHNATSTDGTTGNGGKSDNGNAGNDGNAGNGNNVDNGNNGDSGNNGDNGQNAGNGNDGTGSGGPGTNGNTASGQGNAANGGGGGNGGDHSGNGGNKNGDLVFVPDQNLTGNGDDGGVSGSPGVNGSNLLKPSDDVFGDQPGHDGGSHNPAPVPEPATLTLLGSGLVVLGKALRRRDAARD